MKPRATNQYRRRLWHGTVRLHLDSIYEQGLRDPCLTDDLNVAWYYAETESDATGTDPVVLAADVDPQRLRYDPAAMDEPVAVEASRRDTAWDTAAADHPEWVTRPGVICIPEEAWPVSLQGAASVRHDGTVTPVECLNDPDPERTG